MRLGEQEALRSPGRRVQAAGVVCSRRNDSSRNNGGEDNNEAMVRRRQKRPAFPCVPSKSDQPGQA